MASPLVVALSNTQALSYSDVASVVVITYDILLTLADEVEFIWMKPWTYAKVLYLSARYLPYIGQFAIFTINVNVNGTTGQHWSEFVCHSWFAVQSAALQVVITTVDAILLLRVYALYNRSRKLVGLLAPLFVSESVILCVVIVMIFPTATFNAQCTITRISSLITAYWITSLVFESILFAMTVFKFIQAVRDGWGQRPVMKRFVTDGTWAFALIFLTMLINALLHPLAHSPFAGICFSWLLSVMSFAGSRLVLNSRRAFARPSTSNSTIELMDLPPRPVPATFRIPALLDASRFVGGKIVQGHSDRPS